MASFLPHNETIGKLRSNGLLSTSARSNRILYKFLACTSKAKIHKKSELVHCLQCILSGATQPWPQGLLETMACIHVNQHDGTPRMACLQVFQQNTQKSECMYRRSPIGSPQKKLRVYTASDANWLTIWDIKVAFCNNFNYTIYLEKY